MRVSRLHAYATLEVLEVDILWPRWVARIGVTRSTQACFLAADRQCTELPLLRLPRLVHGFRGSDPMRQTRDLARVGWRGLAPFLPIGPHERPRLADSFPRLGQARGASPGSLDQRSEEWPLCEGKSGALDASVRPSEGGRELRGLHRCYVGSSIHLQRGWWYTALSRDSSAAPPAPPSAPGILTNTRSGIQYAVT